MLRSLRAPLVGVGLVLILGACGAASDAVPAQPTTASTLSRSTAPEPVVVMPTSVATVQAEEPVFTPTGTFNEDDAIAFGIYYVRMINHVRLTGDPALLERYSAADCDTCEYIAAMTEGLRTNGARLVNPELTFEAAYLDFFDPATNEAEVRVEISGDLGQMVLRDGSIAEEPNPLDHASASVQMALVDGNWVLQEVL